LKTLDIEKLKDINGGGIINIGADVRELGQMGNNAWKDIKSGWQGNHEEG